ncbi:MAG TPA: hypothetical protein DEP18_05875 [Flavobacteriales bacterium]|nr:hypothetical protein [Flavobacteriales bacterium]HRE73949.1 hypothetical protein [Flavobacteriales bacterium]HRE96607.1 hypothetical protein [Flavobacteriales bacterium]HRJ39007.1 hypothetical protein [Flavobacteriales bacterium]
MTGKAFRIIFASVLLFLNAFIYSVAFSPNEPAHLHYIPADAQAVICMNSRSIAGTLLYNVFFHEEQIVSLMEGDDESEKIDWTANMDNGLQFLGRITFVIMQAPSGEQLSFMMADVAKESKLEKFLSKREGTAEDLDQAVHFHSDGSVSFAYNNEVALIFTGSKDLAAIKKTALHVLHQKNPSPRDWKTIAGEEDFMMELHPGIEKMDDAPALKGLLGSFISSLRFNGVFGEDGLDMKYVLSTDPSLLANASDVFVLHEHQKEIPVDLLDGIFNLHLTFDPDRWVDWIAKGDLLDVPDSLESKLYGGLRSGLGDKFVLEVDGVRIVRFSEDQLNPSDKKKGISSVPIPEFKAAFALTDPDKIRDMMDQLAVDTLIRKDSSGYYSFSTPFNMDYHFIVQGNVLAMSNTDRYITDIDPLYKGFSNWFYFNSSNFISAIPIDSPFGFMIKGVMEEISTVHYGYGYSVGTNANNVNFDGKIFYNDKKKHSLIETISFMRAIASMFVGFKTPAEDEEGITSDEEY